MDYNDITRAEFRSSRTTNPLSPSYVTRDEDGNRMEIGQIEGSSPKSGPQRMRGPVSSSLNTADIAGAGASSKGKGVFAFHERREVRAMN